MKKYEKQLILNPVENFPDLVTDYKSSEIQGLYVSDKAKTDEIVKNSIIGFSGHSDINENVQKIYQHWNIAMHSSCFSMRLLSGLHAHIILFMGLGYIGDKVMLLPVSAGGHYATSAIMKRLGYEVLEAIPDNENFGVNIEETAKLIASEKPEIIFIDRSEGIYYEDFTQLLNSINYDCVKVFDASQYLTNIIEEDFTSPFEMGFDIIMSTLHKNFPGPQKAMVCSKEKSKYWDKIQDALSSYVSSLHIENLLIADEILNKRNLLSYYSKAMLENSKMLESCLANLKLPIVRRNDNKICNHHLWLSMNNKDDAFRFYKNMESCNILVNYRLLPYDLGYGIRLGTSAATLQGLNSNNIDILSRIIARIYKAKNFSDLPIEESRLFIESLQPLYKKIREV